MHAVILDRATLGDDLDISSLFNLDLQWTVYEQTKPEDMAERMANAEIVLSNKAAISEQEIEAAPRLKYIGILATGTNNVDLEAARKRHITVTNITAYGTPSVAQHAFAMILSLATALPRYSQLSRNGTWANSTMFCVMDAPVMELAGKTMLIAGYGELGKAVGTLAEAFGMKLLIAKVPGSSTSHENRIDLGEGLKQADVVSLHCPLTEHTRHMIGKEQLAQMKSHALLINTARGGLVDEQALVSALKAGELGGAGFDVLTQEPPVNGNPLLDADLPNLIVTPHSAWLAKEARCRLIEMAVGNIRAFLEGTPKSIVV